MIGKWDDRETHIVHSRTHANSNTYPQTLISTYIQTHTHTHTRTHTHTLEMVQRSKPIKKSPFTSLLPCYHSDGLERSIRAGIKLIHFLKGLNKIISAFIGNKAEWGLLLDVTAIRLVLPHFLHFH